MNYSEFLKMGPEIALVLALVIMFVADFIPSLYPPSAASIWLRRP